MLHFRYFSLSSGSIYPDFLELPALSYGSVLLKLYKNRRKDVVFEGNPDGSTHVVLDLSVIGQQIYSQLDPLDAER